MIMYEVVGQGRGQVQHRTGVGKGGGRGWSGEAAGRVGHCLPHIAKHSKPIWWPMVRGRSNIHRT
jgi:hypothetical protein